MSGNIYGYVRVSSRDQNENRQLIAFATLRIPEKISIMIVTYRKIGLGFD